MREKPSGRAREGERGREKPSGRARASKRERKSENLKESERDEEVSQWTRGSHFHIWLRHGLGVTQHKKEN